MLLAFDEVVTGFRLAYGGAQERFGVIPDLAGYGKAIDAATHCRRSRAAATLWLLLIRPRRAAQTQRIYFSCTSVCRIRSAAPRLWRPSKSYGVRAPIRSSTPWAIASARASPRFSPGTAFPLRSSASGRSFRSSSRRAPCQTIADRLCANRPMFEDFAQKMFAKGIFLSRRAKNYISTAHSEKDLDEFLTAADAVCAGGIKG